MMQSWLPRTIYNDKRQGVGLELSASRCESRLPIMIQSWLSVTISKYKGQGVGLEFERTTAKRYIYIMVKRRLSILTNCRASGWNYEQTAAKGGYPWHKVDYLWLSLMTNGWAWGWNYEWTTAKHWVYVMMKRRLSILTNGRASGRWDGITRKLLKKVATYDTKLTIYDYR